MWVVWFPVVFDGTSEVLVDGPVDWILGFGCNGMGPLTGLGNRFMANEFADLDTGG
jgi:hypothetical protein